MATTIIAHRFGIIGTTTVVYQAWEPSTMMGRHSTVTFFDGECYGRIGTDPDGSKFDHLPVGEERFAAVAAAYDERYQLAYAAILEAFPEAADGEPADGEITVQSNHARKFPHEVGATRKLEVD